MAEYRRFVAYVYEYRKGMKGDNCGFVKVEVRERRCMAEVHLHCEGLSSGSECEVYGFIRTEGLLDGILLGRCQTERDQIICALETDAEGVGGTGISLEKLGGMIIRTRSGGFFGTEWDDMPIRPGNFREYREARILQSEAAPDKGQEVKMAEITQADTEEPCVKEESPAVSADGAEKECGRTDRRNPGREDDWPKPDDFRRKAGQPESDDPGKEGDQVGLEPEREEMEAGRERISFPAISGRGKIGFGEEFAPFGDGEFMECRKIRPTDITHFSRSEWGYRNNRFLLYGFYSFGHILLGRRNDGRYILGIPGAYDPQERFMANMSGFPYFKDSAYIGFKNRRGGYWYCFVSPLSDV